MDHLEGAQGHGSGALLMEEGSLGMVQLGEKEPPTTERRAGSSISATGTWPGTGITALGRSLVSRATLGIVLYNPAMPTAPFFEHLSC